MAQEHEQGPVHLRSIHIDLQERSVTLEAEDQTATRLTFSPAGVLYELLSETALLTQAANKLRAWSLRTQQQPEEAQPAEEAASAVPTPQPTEGTGNKEKSPTTVLPGKLQTKPKEGNPDRHGKPTAWAQFLAHVEGREGATLLSTSFHGRTREIALTLNAGDHLTAQGYLHLRPEDPVNPRLSTFSVIHLVHYPNKSVKG
jgi:hypothetical protein